MKLPGAGWAEGVLHGDSVHHSTSIHALADTLFTMQILGSQ